MASYPPPKSYPDNSLPPVFNIRDFNHYEGNATLADLLNYANLYTSNLFTASNYFTSLNFSAYLNGVSPTVFQYINNLATYYYDPNTSGVAIGSNDAISGPLSVPTVNCNSVISQEVICKTLTVDSLTCSSINCNQILCSFLYNNSITYPIIKSGNLRDLTNFLYLTMYITLAPKTRFVLLDSNAIVLYALSNTSDNYLYYQLISYYTFFTPSKFEIFYHVN